MVRPHLNFPLDFQVANFGPIGESDGAFFVGAPLTGIASRANKTAGRLMQTPGCCLLQAMAIARYWR